MNASYYQVIPTAQPSVWMVVKLKGGKLETIAGESEPSQCGCSLNKEGQLIVNEKHTFLPIDEEIAERFSEDYHNWVGQQIYWMNFLPTHQ